MPNGEKGEGEGEGDRRNTGENRTHRKQKTGNPSLYEREGNFSI